MEENFRMAAEAGYHGLCIDPAVHEIGDCMALAPLYREYGLKCMVNAFPAAVDELPPLLDLAVRLGADVPVFIHGRAAWATGIGEVLETIELTEPIYVVIDPKIEVSSAKIFAAQELTRNNDPLTIRAFLRGAGTNVCEPVVRQRYPEVGAALDWLNRHAAARMSGTGACVFAAFDSLEQAEVVKSRVPESWDAYVARAMNRNPVHRQLGWPD